MSSKVLLLKYQPYLPKGTFHASNIRKDTTETRTAIVLNKTADNYISIQGYPPVPCKEKHKCWSLLQQAVKHLLAVPSTTSVCICFADTPKTPVSSLSTLLEQPSQIIDLTVAPLPSTNCNFYTPPAQESQKQELGFRDTRDPYCRYREMYRHSVNDRKPNGLVRQRCNFAEMNRLFSQLTEVNLSLQRTQEECEKIAQKCGPRKTESCNITGRGDSTPPNTKHQSDNNRDSGKGFSPPVSSDTTSTRTVASSEETDSHEARPPSLQSVHHQHSFIDDQKVESLIDTAKSLVQYLGNQKGYGDNRVTSQAISNSTTLYSNHTSTLQPDCPSNVCARPSFQPGGAYIMWNPVSLDAHDNNNSQKILGYQVFIDGQLRVEVENPLSSQVELEHMKHNTEYKVQVCTHGEHSNSILSQSLLYKHIGPQQLSSSKKSQSTLISNNSVHSVQDSNTARVESWLINGQLSVSTASHDSTDLPIHLTKETGPSTHSDHPNTTNKGPVPLVYSHDVTPLGDPCEDTRSIGSSHTSGIVTDYPVSPKLHPACDCHKCSSKLDTLSCNQLQQHHKSDVMMTHYHHGNDTLSMPSSRHFYQDENVLNSKSTSSTLCPSPLPSTLDTVIDEPGNLGESVQTDCGSVIQSRDGHRVPRTGYNHVTYLNAKSHHKAPASPQRVRVVGNTHSTVTVTWNPVERDLKGCSNGCFVLGYRIYVNGTLLHSVDGAMSSRAVVQRPSSTSPAFYGQLMYYVTTRSMYGESLPSKTVAHNSMLQRSHTANLSPRSKKLDSAISSTLDSTSMCTKSESIVSHLHSTNPSTASVASHPMSKRYRMESYV